MNDLPIAKRQRPGSTFVWLAWLVFVLIDPGFKSSGALWAGTLTAVAVFLCVFFIYVRTASANTRRWMVAAAFLIGLVSLPWNSGACTFFIYAAAFLPFSISSARWVLAGFGVEALAVCAETYWLHLHWGNAVFTIFMVVVIGSGNIFFAQEKRANNKLRMAQEEIEALAAMAERERIARDLHDVLGHTLSVIVLKAELAGRLIERNPERASLEIADVERTARTALGEVREAFGGYRARGLAAEIEAARRTLDLAGVRLISDAAPASAAGLSASEETVLALALREAVTNIVRHAQAKTCRLHFVSDDGRRRLLVEDDGEHALAQEGNGLRGMRERVESLGGRMSLDRDRGTRLLIELPFRPGIASS